MQYAEPRETRSEPNLRLAAYPLLGAFALLGMSSQSGSPWLLLPAAALAVYALLVPCALWRVLASGATWRLIGNLALRLAGFAAVIVVAGLLANGGPVLGVLGSLLFIALLGVVALAAFMSIWKVAPRAFMWSGRFVSRRTHGLSHALLLIRLSLTIW